MPLQLQKPAPAFKATAVVDGQFKQISLSDYKGKYVVLFFYPLDLWVCFYNLTCCYFFSRLYYTVERFLIVEPFSEGYLCLKSLTYLSRFFFMNHFCCMIFQHLCLPDWNYCFLRSLRWIQEDQLRSYRRFHRQPVFALGVDKHTQEGR